MTHNPGTRFFLVALCACVLLSAAALLPASPALNVAGAKGPPQIKWDVLAPVSYKNLTVFPVRANFATATDAYITLDEGIKAGTVVITEKGARAARGRRVRRGTSNAANAANRQVQQVQEAVSYNEGASVNELALVNKSGKKLLLLAGEVIVGGQQDRIVQEDLIIPSSGVPIALSVFCVEHGRWTPRSASYGSAGGGAGAGSGEGVVSAVRAPAAAEMVEVAPSSP